MSMKKTTKQYKEEVNKLTNGEYEVLGEYVNNKTKILHKHNKCGNEYLVQPGQFIYGRRCPYCCYKDRTNIFKKSTESYKEEVNKLTNGEYEVLGEYVNNKTKILHKHNKCGNEYLVRPNDFQQGYRCPICSQEENESKGIKLIKKFLKDNQINIETEKKFNDCKYKSNLLFDFYLVDKNILIEFDGQQHFICRRNTKYKNTMSERIKRDWSKNIWCKNHNIKLIRIPYTLSDNKIKKLLEMIINENINIDFITKSHIYYNDGNFVYNSLNYYSQRNSLYYSLYGEEIEEILRHDVSCL